MFCFLQMYSDAAVMDTFERDAVCVTADCEYSSKFVVSLSRTKMAVRVTPGGGGGTSGNS